MFQVRVHGRGGQGVVTAAELLSVAAFREGYHAQAFPSFGSERTGAPVTAFCRIDDVAIRTREPVVYPDALIVQDATLLRQIDVFHGLAPDGVVLVNSGEDVTAFDLPAVGRALTVPATRVALRHLGRPVPNAALLGGFAALTGRISLASVTAAIRGRFSGALADANVAAAEEAFALVTAELSPREGGPVRA